LLQSLEFGASHVYAPQGRTDISQWSKQVVGGLKRGDPALIPQFADRVQALVQQGRFPGFFGPHTTLVPVCGSAPLVAHGLWVPLLIANALMTRGLCRDVAPILRRVGHVPKSAYVPAQQRATLQEHYQSMEVDVVAPTPDRIVLVDDVVTAGCTMFAAARRVDEAYPFTPVRGFALVRTMTGQEITAMIDQCVGTIVPRYIRTHRQP
jgi:predicted amidophosphoribosyltransferase